MSTKIKAIETPAQRLKRETQTAERERWEMHLLRDIRAERRTSIKVIRHGVRKERGKRGKK